MVDTFVKMFFQKALRFKSRCLQILPHTNMAHLFYNTTRILSESAHSNGLFDAISLNKHA